MPAKLTNKEAEQKFLNKKRKENAQVTANYDFYIDSKFVNLPVICYEVEKHVSKKPTKYFMDHANLTHDRKRFGCPECKDYINSSSKRLSLENVNHVVNAWCELYDYSINTASKKVEEYKNNTTKVPYICSNGTQSFKTFANIQQNEKCGCKLCRRQYATEQFHNVKAVPNKKIEEIHIETLLYNDKVIYTWATPENLDLAGCGYALLYKEQLKKLGYDLVGYNIQCLSEMKGQQTPIILRYNGLLYRCSKLSHALNKKFSYRVNYTYTNLEYYYYNTSFNKNKIKILLKETQKIGVKEHILTSFIDCGCQKTYALDVLMNRNIDNCTECTNYSEALCIAADIDPMFEHFDIIKEKRFEDCKSKNPLPFDRMIEGLDLLLEYDGQQHFDKNNQWYTEEGIERDRIKTEYAINNGYNFIRIAYYEDHEVVLESFLKLVLQNPDKQIVQIYGEVQILDKN